MFVHAALLAASLLSATPDTTAPRALHAHRLTAGQGAPVLDGRLDDAIWAATDSIDGFTQVKPDPGRPARFRTVTRVAFDDAALYVAVRAYDPEPAKIVAELTRRDQGSASDQILVAIDSHHDRRTAYIFGVNPAGVKTDIVLTDGKGEDSGWDAVWDVATRRDELGWTAEFRIPLAALRFATEGDGVWGFQVIRDVQRTQERSAWAPFRQEDPTFVARFGELVGMRGLRAPRRLEMLPYTVSGLSREPLEGGVRNPFRSSTEWTRSAGLDVKYGLTAGLTLDATINPDFGQVEADPSQVNLSAYETFLSEQRPFFTEGAEIFRFGTGVGDGSSESLFYSRRIGRSPQRPAGEPDGGFVDNPTQTRILGAAKLSGRVGPGWSLGLLSSLTGESSARLSDATNARSEQVVEPMTSYSVARLRRDLNEGRTQLGVIGTSVVRRMDGTGIDDLRSSALAGGVDFSHRWKGDGWQVSGWLLGSRVAGSEESILATQRSSARYFQRRDAGHVRLDSAATSLGGWAASYQASKIGGRWRGGLLGNIRSPGFETNDLGYQRDADQVMNVAYLGYRNSTPRGWFQRTNANSNFWVQNDFGGTRTALGGNVNGSVTLRSYWSIYGGIAHGAGALSNRALRGGVAIRTPASSNGWLGVESDDRRALRFGTHMELGREEETGGHSLYGSLDGRWRINSSTSLSLSPFYSVNHDAWQFVDELGEGTSMRYVFGELEQKTAGLGVRMEKTFMPTLSLQLFARPFVSAGRYESFREATDPRARRFDARFHTFSPAEVRRGGGSVVLTRADRRDEPLSLDEPDFSVRDFKLNAVLRWEYRTGSTLFVAWSHGQSGDDARGDFRLRRDLNALFREPSHNVVMIKANWWVSL
jgi:hypothetical protein